MRTVRKKVAKRATAAALLIGMLCSFSFCRQVGDAPMAGKAESLYPTFPILEASEGIYPIPSETGTLGKSLARTEMEKAGMAQTIYYQNRTLLWLSDDFELDIEVNDQKLRNAKPTSSIHDLILLQQGDYLAVVGSFEPLHGCSRVEYQRSCQEPGQVHDNWNCNFGVAVLGTTYQFQVERALRGEAAPGNLNVFLRNVGVAQGADGTYYNNNYIDFTQKNAEERRYVLILVPDQDNYGYVIRDFYCANDAPRNAEERWMFNLLQT